ncbi:DgyrCDS2339 [Dimorphilus gyrociliatus]|uniref:DgyrCDS2339 n=1 Tax=Dimorphilus gyrociliatus TaxID=2664684 RepID=A0A7I8V9Z5_9ANNE|nr:DgyrCDS2339 [Dimorphilus gyrociliatus]
MDIGKTKAEDYVNDSSLEMHWALKAYQHAETYQNLLEAVGDTKSLKLTKIDEHLYANFEKEFPDFELSIVEEQKIKTKEQKEKWRNFCNQYENCIPEWNMGTLLRSDCSKGVSPDNTFIVPRIQFLTIEVARNRRGLNKKIGS